jgi:hypothetical protein
MPTFSRLSALLAGLLFGVPTLARADMECLSAKALRGPVKTVVVSKGKVVAGTGAIRTPPRRWERIDISRDRRTVSVVQYSSDGGSILPLVNLWPTTTCDFDAAGRVVLARLKMNGLTTYTRVEMTYDSKGRLVRRKSWSHNPEFTYDRTYDYSAKTVTTLLSRGTVTRGMTELDEMNPLLVSVVPPSRDLACQHDIHGNWTRCVNPLGLTAPAAGSLSDLVVREIVYWPRLP